MKMVGIWDFKHLRRGALLKRWQLRNTIADVGANSLLDVYLGGTTPVSPWYIGIIGTGGSAPHVGDTMASHGWVENVDYSETTRRTFVPVAGAASRAIQCNYVTFNISVNTIINGIFLASSNVKSGSAGILWTAKLYASGPVSLSAFDTFQASYMLTI